MSEMDAARAAGSVQVGDRVALVASYDSGPRVTRSLAELVDQLRSSGYQVIMVRASEDPSPLRWPSSAPDGVTVIRRANSAYDFGSWSEGLRALPAVRRAPYVLLLNDSLVGPFASIAPLIQHFEATEADAWGAVQNPQITIHLQSFFLGFRGGILDDKPLRDFWNGVRPQPEKMDYVLKYELGLARALWSEAYSTDSPCGYGIVGPARVNPTLDRWDDLLLRGFPFVKRSLLTDRENRTRATQVAETVAARYDTDIADWL